MKMTHLLRYLVLMSISTSLVRASVTLPDISKEKLSHLGNVFDVTDGEATIKSLGIKRVEIGNSSIVVTMDNSIPAAGVVANFTIYTRAGMRTAWTSIVLPAHNASGEITKSEGTLNHVQDLPDLLGNTEVDLNPPFLSPAFVVITFDRPPITVNHRPKVVKILSSPPAIFEERTAGTRSVGLRGIDAKWSNYGTYLQKMLELVQAQYDKLNTESRISPPVGSTVTVKFTLNSKGEVRITAVDASRGTNAAAKICTSAIEVASPFNPWSDSMRTMLGVEQGLTCDFYYP